MQFLLGSQYGTKRELLELLMADGMVMIHLDATRPEVEVPPRHKGDLHLRLNLSFNFRLPDLEIDDQGVRATLSFGGSGFYCVLPWVAVFAFTSHTKPVGYVWPDDLPEELAEHATMMARTVARRQGPQKPSISVIKGGPTEAVQEVPRPQAVPSDTTNDEPEPPPPEPAPESPPEGRRYGHLRVIK